MTTCQCGVTGEGDFCAQCGRRLGKRGLFRWNNWVLWVIVCAVAFVGICGIALALPPVEDAEDAGSPGVPTIAFTPTAKPIPTAKPALPAVAPTSPPTPKLTPTAKPALPTVAPTSSPTPETRSTLNPGMYQVGSDIRPGIYVGLAGTEVFDSCYWARLSGASGGLSDLNANDNARGQFYVEVQPTDKFFRVRCEVTPLEDWPAPTEPLSEIGPGTYLIGRDIAPGIYVGLAGTEVFDSCYWARLSGVSGDLSDLNANGNARGQFYVEVQPSDYALNTRCTLKLTDE